MDSTETQVTHYAIVKRAERDALDRMPDFPKKSTVGNWECFIEELESLDAYEIAHELAEWDWVIYYHRAMELCQAVPSAVLHEAESEFADMGGPNGMGDSFGLYEYAATLAHLIVVRAIVEAVEECRDELLELASEKNEQVESV